MTNKEAIKDLKQLLRWYVKEEPMSETMYIREAVQMAIKALEQEHCEDCVSRQAVLEIFGNVHPLDYNANAYIIRIKELPSVQPKQKEDDA